MLLKHKYNQSKHNLKYKFNLANMERKIFFYEGLPYEEISLTDNTIIGKKYWSGEEKECDKDKVEYLKQEE